MSIQEEKKKIRQKIKSLKKSVSTKDLMTQSKAICLKLELNPLFMESENILLYWSMPDEVDTINLLNKWYKNKRLYLPVIHGDDLKISQYLGEASLIAGDKYGIPEPGGESLDDESIIELVIVPGLAFDDRNNRMGRGAGYYDRILNRLPKANKIGLAYHFQMLKQVPVEGHDIKMDQVISSNGT